MTHISTLSNLRSKIKTVIFDCDGVLWLLNDILPGAKEIVQYLNQNQIRVFFVSNNSTKTTDEYLQKFSKLGFGDDIKQEQVISAAKITARCLSDRGVKKAFVLGAKAIDYEMGKYGVEAVRHEEEMEAHGINFDLDPNVEAVVAGMDVKINYNKLAIGSTYMMKQKVPYYATNADAFLPNPDGKILPGGGTLVGAFKAVTGVDAEVFGKPGTSATKFISDFNPKQTMMVGDRIDTDIQFGVNIGAAVSCLVMTGASGKEHLKELGDLAGENGFYAEGVDELLEALKK